MSEKTQHIYLTGTAAPIPFTSPSGGGGTKFKYPARDRAPHADKLTRAIESARATVEQHVTSSKDGITVRGLTLECVSSVDHALKVDSLDDKSLRLEVLSTHEDSDRTHATVFVPSGQLAKFVKKIDRYKSEERADTGAPKNQALVESIDQIRVPLVRSFWTDADELFPASEAEATWFEVWLRTEDDEEQSTLERFRIESERVGLNPQADVIHFPGRSVVITHGTLKQWTKSLSLFGDVAELRLAKHVPTDFVELPARELGPFVAEGAGRVAPPPKNAPSVCILDTGVQTQHPLLVTALDEIGAHAVEERWTPTDNHGHGTQMAGIALFGEGLPDHLLSQEQLQPTHRLESTKLFDEDEPHERRSYGAKTEESVAIAEARAPERSRVICLAITADDRDGVHPSSWSAAIDQHAAGALDEGERRRLYAVSAGNILDQPHLATSYPELNHSERCIEDPAQAWNALTVGACTDRLLITHDDFANHSPVAPRGGLSPKSRTSVMWNESEWPLKPDIVMEGGNYAAEDDGEIQHCDDLQLLSTAWSRTGKQLETMADTSAATALASRLAARLSAAYPTYWPETIRALLVHSAQWTDRMREEFPGDTKANVQARLRCYGYGIPNEERAFWTAANVVTLVAQAELTPYMKGKDGPTTDQCHFHELPWPRDVLDSLGDQEVTVRVTLSYFIEPSPGRIKFSTGYRYASHGLRFVMRGKDESDAAFEKRVTTHDWTDEEKNVRGKRPNTAERQNWAIGSKLRTRGSIHSDWFTAPAVEVGHAGRIAVYPVTGWWRERHHLGKLTSKARYALVVTISTPETKTNLLAPIQATVQTPIKTQT